MTDLGAFLLARVAEDEAANRVGPEPESWCDRGEGLHLSHERMAGECKAKRLIVEQGGGSSMLDVEGAADAEHEWTMQCLALAYADHSDYRPEWRP